MRDLWVQRVQIQKIPDNVSGFNQKGGIFYGISKACRIVGQASGGRDRRQGHPKAGTLKTAHENRKMSDNSLRTG